MVVDLTPNSLQQLGKKMKHGNENSPSAERISILFCQVTAWYKLFFWSARLDSSLKQMELFMIR
jgi:hypothetical protein